MFLPLACEGSMVGCYAKQATSRRSLTVKCVLQFSDISLSKRLINTLLSSQLPDSLHALERYAEHTPAISLLTNPPAD
jgi:hypothetical protein